MLVSHFRLSADIEFDHGMDYWMEAAQADGNGLILEDEPKTINIYKEIMLIYLSSPSDIIENQIKQTKDRWR